MPLKVPICPSFVSQDIALAGSCGYLATWDIKAWDV